MNYSEIRSEARGLLRGQWGMMAVVWLIYFVLTYGAYGHSEGLGSIISLVISGPFALGISTIILKLYRRENFHIEEMFNGFRDFARSLVAFLLIALYVFLWALLFIIPGIIAAISYSMTFFIMAEDPNIPATDAMRKSKEMMLGHKSEYFMLMLSFIGWGILSLISMGVGFLFLQSYMMMSAAIFYKKIQGLHQRVENVVTPQDQV